MDTSEFLQIVRDKKYVITTNEQWAAHVHYMLNRADLKRAAKELFVGFRPLEDWFEGGIRLSTMAMPEHVHRLESARKHTINYATYCRKLGTIDRQITTKGDLLDTISMYLSRNAVLFTARVLYQRDIASYSLTELSGYTIRLLDTPPALEVFFAQLPKWERCPFCHMGEFIERALVYFAHDSWQERSRSAQSCELLKNSLTNDYKFVGSRSDMEIDSSYGV
jgi:hypothetical protein